jgi:cytochrome c biogenesis protein CcmG/thiol:disulfide interchange protein DsbE
MLAVEAVRPARPRWVRLVWFVAPALAFVALLGAGLARRPGPPGPGDTAPAFEAPLLRGRGTLALSDLVGRPVVLNFWASWCVPCEDEAPLLQAAHERYKDEVAFVGINIRDARSDALAFVERFGITFPSVRDEGLQIYSAYGLTGQPETFFIASDGRIVEHVPGPLSGGDLEQLVRRLLEGR